MNPSQYIDIAGNGNLDFLLGDYVESLSHTELPLEDSQEYMRLIELRFLIKK